MGTRGLAGGVVVAALVVVAMPATGQDPAPACAPDQQLPLDRFEFTHSAGSSRAPTQSEFVGHPAELFISVNESGSPWIVSALRVTGPSGLKLSSQGDDSHDTVTFTPTALGQLTLTAMWKQYKEPSGPACTGSASASLTAIAPRPVRLSASLGFTLAHRPGHPGNTNEFVLQALVVSDALRGDFTPIRFTARAVEGARQPTAGTPAATLTLDPSHVPSHGVRASSPLLRLQGGYHGDHYSVYEFQAGVSAYPPHGRGRARRSVEMTLSQGSRTLGTIHYSTACGPIFGGLECIPLPKGVHSR